MGTGPSQKARGKGQVLKPGDVCIVDLNYRGANYPRPCFVVHPGPPVIVAPISSQHDLYDPTNAAHVRLSPSDDGWADSSLDRESFANLDDLQEVELSSVRAVIGKLSGALKRKIEAELGPL